MNKRLVILGSGESGIGAALLGKKLGWDVFLSEYSTSPKPLFQEELMQNNIACEFGQHTLDLILNADVIVKSPGIPEKAEVIKKIREQKIEIISEIEWGFRHMNQDAKIIAITGSNGKSTTTSLIYEIFKNDEKSVSIVGNIGVSFARQIVENPTEYYILEVSSFQLDDIVYFRPNVAIILNISPDHLDRYDYQMQNYIQAKFKLLQNQTEEDFAILNLDDIDIRKYEQTNTINSKKIYFTMQREFEDSKPTMSFVDERGQVHFNLAEPFKVPISDLGLLGKHNTYNSMAAGISAQLMNLRNEKIRESLKSYRGIEHRLEFVAKVKGVEFINDSKATNLNSVWYALECMTAPVILILGGVDKGNDYSEIFDLVKSKVKNIICLGTDNSKIIEAFKNDFPNMKQTGSMGAAVLEAFNQAEAGNVVLLSPACASFDLFENYEDRGRQFKEIVKSL